MPDGKVLREYHWTEQELRDDGFRYYKQWKRVVLARELLTEEAPLTILIPAFINASVHGGVLPIWQHGSSVT